MKFVLRGAQVYTESGFSHLDILVDDGFITGIAPSIPFSRKIVSFDLHSCFLFPGLIDVHVISESRDFHIKKP